MDQEKTKMQKTNSSPVGQGLYVTIFADASRCHETGAYGWAAWVKHGHPAQTLRVSGGGQGLATSNEAELHALNQAVQACKRAGVDMTDKIVVIQSDCTGAIDKFKRNQIPEARDVKLKHVRGHQGMKTPRGAVNTWCDRSARREMREVRKQISLEIVSGERDWPVWK